MGTVPAWAQRLSLPGAADPPPQKAQWQKVKIGGKYFLWWIRKKLYPVTGHNQFADPLA